MPALNKKFLPWIIAAISFLLSIGYSFAYRIPPVVDAQAYDRIAINSLDGFGFKEDPSKSFEFDTAIVRAGPGYEFFLAGVYGLFGRHYQAVWIIQALLHAVSTGLLYLICRQLFSEHGDKIGLIAAILFGLHPDLIEISAMLMTETLYLFLIIVAVYFFAKSFQEPSNRLQAAMLGLSVGTAILTRPPVGLFVPPILFFYYRTKSYRSGLWFVCLLGIVLAPWIIRNYLIFHQLIPTTLIGSYNIWIGNTLASNGGQISGGFNPITAYTDVYGFAGLKARASQEFMSFIITHPLIFLKLCFLRVIRYFSLFRPMGFWFYQTGLKQMVFVLTSAIAIVILFISGFSGMLAALRARRAIFYYLILFAAISPLVLIPTVVQSRYRFQIYPFLTIFAGYFFNLWRLNRPLARRAAIITVCSLGVISLIDAIVFWPAIQSHVKIFF